MNKTTRQGVRDLDALAPKAAHNKRKRGCEHVWQLVECSCSGGIYYGICVCPSERCMKCSETRR